MRNYTFLFLFVFGFLSCKRSTSVLHRNYDQHLIDTLTKLNKRYAGNKVRINTWDKQADAYLDIQVLDKYNQVTDTLTIGDSVKFIRIDTSWPEGIRAKVVLSNRDTGYVPYWKIEELEPAKKIDPDQKY